MIAKRMKHGHRSWSRSGGNHLAKILAKKCSGKLNEVTERLRRPVFEEEKVGLNETMLRNMMSLKLNANSINEFGRFDWD